MKKHTSYTVIIVVLIGITFSLSAQVGITTDGSSPDPSAMLDVKSNNKGILIPRMGTVERNQIPSPATGLLIYNTTTNLFNYYNGNYWYQIEATFISSAIGSIRPGGGVSINATQNTPADSSAMLDVNNSTRGILIPRATPGLITLPAVGLIIYNISTNHLEYYSNSGWCTLCTTSVGVTGAGGSQSLIGIAINTTGSDVHQSSILDVSSNDKGLLIPRLNNIQRNGILPVTGLTIFNTTSNAIEYYNGSGWYGLNINLPAGVSITASANPVITGTSVTFTATPVNGGNTPSYQWKVNGINVGSNSSTYSYIPINNDTISCVITSNLGCVSNNPATSNTIIMVVLTPIPCPGIPTISYGGQTYNTVQIGTQCWLKENLNIGTQINGSKGQTNNDTIEKYCYNNLESNCSIYGGLYQWNEMMQYFTVEGVKGICPDGWYLPSDSEWCALEQYVDPTINCEGTEWRGTNGGTKLKQGGSSGFEAKMGGGRDSPTGAFFSLNSSGYYWTSTQNSTDGWFRSFSTGNAKVYRSSENKNLGFSVRCIKGESSINMPPDPPYNPQPTDGALNQEINSIMSWSCSDPDNDPLIYDVYFGSINPPTLIVSGQTDITYNPGEINYSTDYFWKIVVHDDHGHTTVGPIWSFTTRGWQCGDSLDDSRDGKSYSTILIGSQCWMKENLNIGTLIPGINTMTNNSIIEKYCYNDDENNCNIYGGLYQWNEMMQYSIALGTQGICPPVNGWYIPTDGDWSDLMNYLGGEDISGGKLKEAGTTHWNTPNTGATNSSGFTALPAGIRSYSDNNFYIIGQGNILWSSNKFENSYAWFRWLSCDSVSVFHMAINKNNGNSVRCVKNLMSSNLPPDYPTNPSPSDMAQNQPRDITLSWSCTDPENDPLSYDVFFGVDFPLPLVSSGQSGATYDPPGLLIAGQSYGWKIIVHDNYGNHTEGPVWVFTTTNTWLCGDALLDTRDGHSYNTVSIGSQCWMAQNLNIGTPINSGWSQTNNGFIEKYCYNDDISYCDIYGGLYQWNEMMQYSTTQGAQGICLTGWHIPTDGEWTTLTTYLGGTGVAGGKLKETGTTHWQSPNTGATNESGFTALPGGYCYYTVPFYGNGKYGFWWSSTEFGNQTSALYRVLGYNYSYVHRDYYSKLSGYSVRCLKDN